MRCNKKGLEIAEALGESGLSLFNITIQTFTYSDGTAHVTTIN
jgi:hypothetical protein